MSGVSNNWNMEHEVYHEVTTKEDPLDSPMVIQPFIKASNENDEESLKNHCFQFLLHF